MRLLFLSVMASAALFGLSPEAHAETPLPTLESFLAEAKRFSPSEHQASALVAQRRAQIASAVGQLLPSLTAQGGYTRNQYEVAISFPPLIEHAVISPHNQWDGQAVLAVPLLDLGAIFSLTAADSGLGATRAQAADTSLTVESQVTQGYYQHLANLALETASQKALDVALAGEQLTQARLSGGRASKLDADRARGEVEAQRQQLAGAHLQRLLSARTLASATGLNPPNDAIAPDLAAMVAELPPPPAEATQAPDIDGVPRVRAASLQTRTLAKQAWVQRLALVPKLSGSFTERFTNAPGFVPRTHYWMAGAKLTWQLDVSLFANMRVADAQLAVSRAEEQQARLGSRDAIYRAEETIVAAGVRVKSARAQAEVSQAAREVAEERYQAGSLTQLDLLGAQRDAFAAQVAFIQAESDLINAHAQRRLAGGNSLLIAKSTR